jgi:phosphoribosylamine--glycine ligase
MNVLITGSGGREHALAWKVAQSPLVDKVFVAPGNAGTATEQKIENIDIDVMDFAGQIEFAKNNNIELTIIGPEAPLVGGVVNVFKENGLKCFGPDQGAAQLEGSKTFAKDFLSRHNIPSGNYQNFTEVDPALAYIQKQGAPIVVKADGLAAGKGVIVAMTEAEAEEAVRDMLSGNAFGEAGCRVVIEEFLEGEEASFIVMVDGENIIEPTVQGMAAEGNSYTGFLYAGLMINNSGEPRVIEYNCRFGDPETQPIMMRLQSDLAAHCMAALDGKLDSETARWDERPAVGVVMASGGYPGSYKKGEGINGLDGGDIHNLASDHSRAIKVFHAGTKLQGANITTNGGRVLCVTALGPTVAAAQQLAYQRAATIDWIGAFYRTDIAYRAIARDL